MSAVSPLNGRASPLQRASNERLAPERHADESLHDFLLRRHDEMVGELDALQAEMVWKDVNLHAERRAAHRHRVWLIAGLALDATLAMFLTLAGIFDAVPTSVAAITLGVMLAGKLLAIGMPRLDPVLVSLSAWSPR
jgi:hypothetical protein